MKATGSKINLMETVVSLTISPTTLLKDSITAIFQKLKINGFIMKDNLKKIRSTGKVRLNLQMDRSTMENFTMIMLKDKEFFTPKAANK
jgi:hypothetical protein